MFSIGDEIKFINNYGNESVGKIVEIKKDVLYIKKYYEEKKQWSQVMIIDKKCFIQ